MVSSDGCCVKGAGWFIGFPNRGKQEGMGYNLIAGVGYI